MEGRERFEKAAILQGELAFKSMGHFEDGTDDIVFVSLSLSFSQENLLRQRAASKVKQRKVGNITPGRRGSMIIHFNTSHRNENPSVSLILLSKGFSEKGIFATAFKP
jgi:hypothetical protein